MTTKTQIRQKRVTLTPDLKKEVLDFMNRITTKQEKLKSKKIPVFGTARGQFQTTSDFDAPLEDFKEYME
jgi:predicted nucleotidyltransferase